MTTRVSYRPTVVAVNVIRCEGLTKTFGRVVAVDGLDLEVAAGQVYGLLGPNGAGKTTTIRMLLGLIAPSAGRAWVLDREVPDPRIVAETGSMIEEPAFYPWLSGRANLRVLAKTRGGCPEGDLSGVLEAVGLSEMAARKVKTYSQGMRQRLGLAAAMLGRPALLIVDEPTNSLDPAGIREIRGVLRDLADRGATVFLSSHLLAEVEQVCDRVAVFVRGRLVEEGPPATLGAARRHVRVEVAEADVDVAGRLLSRWPGARDGLVFQVGHEIGRDVNGVLAAGGVIAESVTVRQSSLESRFLELVDEMEEDADAVAARR